jgi:excisionase family DNA binding protein
MNKYLSTTEAAKLLGISRVAVFNRIKKGQIKAIKVGRNFIIDRVVLGNEHYEAKTPEERTETINKAMDKIFKEYEETIKKLGKE